MALLGITVAVRLPFSPPTVKSKVVELSVTPVTAMVAALTVTSQVAVLSPAVAVIVADPAATAVTVPFDTVATCLLLDSHVTSVSEGLTDAVIVFVSPSVISKVV